MEASERSEVSSFPYDRDKAFLRGLRTLFSGVANVVSVGHSVAVKVHMGEYGGRADLRPPIVC
jgi:uncharacterized Fe-S center protein